MWGSDSIGGVEQFYTQNSTVVHRFNSSSLSDCLSKLVNSSKNTVKSYLENRVTLSIPVNDPTWCLIMIKHVCDRFWVTKR